MAGNQTSTSSRVILTMPVLCRHSGSKIRGAQDIAMKEYSGVCGSTTDPGSIHSMR